MIYYDGSEFTGYEIERYSDKPYIDEVLGLCPRWAVDGVVDAYSKRYQEILNDESIPEHQRVGKARYECNTRLRRCVENLRSSHAPEKTD